MTIWPRIDHPTFIPLCRTKVNIKKADTPDFFFKQQYSFPDNMNLTLNLSNFRQSVFCSLVVMWRMLKTYRVCYSLVINKIKTSSSIIILQLCTYASADNQTQPIYNANCFLFFWALSPLVLTSCVALYITACCYTCMWTLHLLPLLHLYLM